MTLVARLRDQQKLILLASVLIIAAFGTGCGSATGQTGHPATTTANFHCPALVFNPSSTLVPAWRVNPAGTPPLPPIPLPPHTSLGPNLDAGAHPEDDALCTIGTVADVTHFMTTAPKAKGWQSESCPGAQDASGSGCWTYNTNLGIAFTWLIPTDQTWIKQVAPQAQPGPVYWQIVSAR